MECLCLCHQFHDPMQLRFHPAGLISFSRIFHFISAFLLMVLPQISFGSTPPTGVITGTIVSQENKKPIEYATISLYQMSDSSLVSGAITDSTGSYRMEKVPHGTYSLKVEFLGCESAWSSSFTLSRKVPAHDVGKMELRQSALALEGVDIVSERNMVEYHLDKKVINVGAENAVPAGSAVDILQSAPSIQTDASGDVTLRGSANFRVLIDGKPSVLSGNDALRNIPSASIQSIEIITNPSAKYDADGTSGIINVILKKGQRSDGISGFAEASASRYDRYTANLMLSQRIGKVNWFVGLDYTDRPTPGSSILERTTLLNDTTRYQLADADRNWLRKSVNVKTGIDYQIGPATSISYSLTGGQQTNSKGTNSLDLQRTSFGSDVSNEYFLRTYSDENEGNLYSNALDFSHQWKDKNQLSLNLLYTSWDGDHVIGFTERLSDASGNSGSTQTALETTENNVRNNFQASLDYTLKASENVDIEAGLRSRWIEADALYQFTAAPDSIAQEDQDGVFNRWVHAAYGTYAGKFKSFEYKVGLRAEYTDRKVTSSVADGSFSLDHLHWFPSVHLSRSVGKRQQVKASYSRRIKRPGEWSLFPFLTYIDPFNQQIGNPQLNPDLTDSYELGYTKGWKRNFLSLEAYHRFTRNAINNVRVLGEGNSIVQSVANIAQRRATGLEGSLNLSLHKKVSLMVQANVFALEFDGNLNESTNLEERTVTWNTFSMINITVPYDARLQLMGFYYAPSVGPQGETGSFWMVTARLNKQVLKKQLDLGFEVSDIFRTMRHNFRYTDPTFDVFNEFRFRGQIFKVSAAYTFNKFNQRKVKQRLNKNKVELEPTSF